MTPGCTHFAQSWIAIAGYQRATNGKPQSIHKNALARILLDVWMDFTQR